ncbi:tetratricopeptide repeat protein [Sorangium sp. So ce1000]|uniref:tetratricopeptide repeat protein n=1 Tax=Sorangium sp. So ce1000 TaxID=3133325 RepID=UPI003F613100
MTTDVTAHRGALDLAGRLALGFIAACVVAGCRDQPPRPTAESAPPSAASSAVPVASASSAAPSASPASPVSPAPSARPLTEKEKQALATYKAALARGRLATKKLDFNAAIQAFTEAIAADPSDARALAERGFAHLTAGDSDAADSDFNAALAGAGDPELRSQIWFNLGLLRDRAGDAEAARVAYANAHLLKPSAATRGKLAGRSTCTVEVRKADLEGAELVNGWTELLARVGTAEEAPGEAESESAARERLCKPDSRWQTDSPCAGDPPWVFPRDYMMYVHHSNHVVFPRKPEGFLVVNGGHSGGWPAHCQGIRSVSGSVEGGLLVVESSFHGAGAVVDGEVDGEMRCRDGASYRERTFYDARTGRAMVALRWPAGSEADVKVQGGQLVVSGGGCDERFRFDVGAGAGPGLGLGLNVSTK